MLVGAFVAAAGPASSSAHLFLERDGNFLLVHAGRGVAGALGDRYRAADRAFACLGTAVVIARPLQARVPAAPAGDAAERGRDRRPARLRRAAQTPRRRGCCLARGCSLLLVPAVFLAGLLHSRLARGGVADLFGEMRTLRGAELQARLARAAGRPEPRRRLSRRRRRLRRRGRRPGRAAARRRPLVRPLDGAALIYDSALDEDPGLVEVVAAAAAIALEHEQLDADVAGVAAAADRGRATPSAGGSSATCTTAPSSGSSTVAIQLRLIEADIRRDPAAAEALVTTASGELARSLEELRELARGIHPAVLEHGLALGA